MPRQNLISQKSVLNLCTSFMAYITIVPPPCFSHAHDFEVSEDVIDYLSWFKYDGEGRASLLRHGVSFTGFCHRNEVPSNDIAFGLFTYTFERCVNKWCRTLPTTSIHSYDHMLDDFFVLSIIMNVNNSIKNFWNYRKHLMNLLHNFGSDPWILPFKSPKMKLIRNFSGSGLSIFFTYLKILTC